MSSFDTSTPQLKAAKRWIDAYTSLDTKKIAAATSKNYEYQALPEVIGIPEEAKEKHLERYRDILGAMAKAEVINHEVIEAPGKVIFHATRMISAGFGGTFAYDTITILTIVEEDGELKVFRCKDFSDPEKRTAFYIGMANIAAQNAAA